MVCFKNKKNTRCCFLQPEEEEGRTGVLLLCSRKPGFVYLFQEWFVSRTRRKEERTGVVRSGTRKKTRKKEEPEEKPGTTLLVVSC